MSRSRTSAGRTGRTPFLTHLFITGAEVNALAQAHCNPQSSHARQKLAARPMASPRISITSTYYECFWVLSISIRVGRHQLKMETPGRNQTPILRYRGVMFTSEYLKDSLSAVCPVLGVHRVRQGLTVLFEVDFSEDKALEEFCKSLSDGMLRLQNRTET